jgi:LuxR family maltose regulon positive regulatory protein
LLGPPAPSSFTGLVTALVNQLAESAPPPAGTALIIDDFHVIESAQVVDSFAYLVEHRPAALGLLVGSRMDPPLPLARLRVRGELTEVRAEQLRFTAQESAALLRGALGTDLPAGDVAALTARTEGWAAGLHLAGLSLRGETDPARFVANFSGSHRFVLDYLTEEVIARQPAHVTEFLLQTSPLDRLSGPLCDAVTGRSDGQQMLERLERDNLFLVPLDDVRGWWRYHHLFADLLRARLLHQYPDRVAHLHAAASDWYEEHGHAEAAVQHAFAARAFDRAAELIERHADRMLLRSEGLTIQRWLSALPAATVSTRPRLLLVRARLALLRGRTDEAESALAAAEQAVAAQPRAAGPAGLVDDYQPSVAPGASLLVNVPATIALDRAYLAELRGDAEAAAVYAARALSSIQDREWMLRSHAGGYLALARWLHGRLPEAERLLADSVARWRTAGERYLAVRGCHHLGQVRRAQGRLAEATEAYRLAIEVASTPGGAAPAAGVGHVGLAELAYQRGDLDQAHDHALEGIALCRQLAYRQPLATGLATLAWIQHARGERDRARRTMDEAAETVPMHGITTLLNPVPAQWARLCLAQGDLAAAAAWVRERGVGPHDTPDYAREPDHLVLARVLLAEGRGPQAQALLDRLYVAASAQERFGSLVEIRALQGLAFAAAGDRTGTAAALADALAIACAPSTVRVFVDEGAPMLAALGELVATQRAGGAARDVPLGCLGRVMSAFDAPPDGADTGPGGRRPVQVPGLVDQLTARELEVLQLLATGQSNRDIATNLFVSLDTVKKHVSRVLDKLGATNRTEAVARAREFHLVR